MLLMKLPLLTFVTFLVANAQTPKGAPVKIDGDSHKLILFSDGAIGGWGDSRDGQLGPRASIPNVSGHATAFVPIAMPPGKVVDVAASARTSYALFDDGTVAAFGSGSDGQLGCGESCLSGSETPGSRTGPAERSTHSRASLHGIRHSPRRQCQHLGARFQGEGPTRILTPELVANLPPISQISIGTGFVLALTTEGRVWMWGKLPFGRIYADDPVQAPAEVPGLTGVASGAATQVAAVLKTDGTVWVWGNNEQAQFGNGKRDIGDRTRVPVRVPGIANVAALSASGRHFLALLKDGTLRGWGNSDWGQIGAGVTGREQASPVIPRISGVKAVFAAGNNSFAVRNDGSLWIWGLGSVYKGVWPMTKQAPSPTLLQIPAGVAAP